MSRIRATTPRSNVWNLTGYPAANMGVQAATSATSVKMCKINGKWPYLDIFSHKKSRERSWKLPRCPFSERNWGLTSIFQDPLVPGFCHCWFLDHPIFWDISKNEATNTHRIHVCMLYMLTWIPSIYPLYVSIYTSTMDPSWDRKTRAWHHLTSPLCSPTTKSSRFEHRFVAEKSQWGRLESGGPQVGSRWRQHCGMWRLWRCLHFTLSGGGSQRTPRKGRKDETGPTKHAGANFGHTVV